MQLSSDSSEVILAYNVAPVRFNKCFLIIKYLSVFLLLSKYLGTTYWLQFEYFRHQNDLKVFTNIKQTLNKTCVTVETQYFEWSPQGKTDLRRF